jgi:hypothetical protein
LIKTLIAMAHVVGFDETTRRCGPAGDYFHPDGPTSPGISLCRASVA